jgi:hypothetical protein
LKYFKANLWIINDVSVHKWYIPPLFSSYQKEKSPTSQKKQENLLG